MLLEPLRWQLKDWLFLLKEILDQLHDNNYNNNTQRKQNVCMSFRRHLGTKYSNYRHTIIYI